MQRLAVLTLFACSAYLFADAPMIVHGDPLPPGAIARFGIPGLHQNEFVSAGAHTTSGAFRVAVAKEKEIRVWSWQPVASRPPVHLLAGHSAAVQLVAMSPDGRFLASADKAGEVRVWELATGELEIIRKAGPSVFAIAIGNGGRRIVVSSGKEVTLHDRSANRRYKIGEHERDVTALAISPASSRIATGDDRGTIAIWNVNGTKVADLAWQPIPEPKEEPPIAPPILKGPGEMDGALRVIDFNRGVRKLVFSPDAKQVVAGGGTVVRAWEIEKRKVLWQHNRHSMYSAGGQLSFSAIQRPTGPRQLGRVWDLAFSRDGEYVASTGNFGDVRIVHADHGEDLREPNATERFTKLETRFTGRVGLAFGPDGRSLTMFDGARKFVRETIARGVLLGTVSGHGSSVTGLAVSHDGKWLASAGDDARIQIWKLATGECVAEPRTALSGGRGAAFSPDGKWLVAGGAYHGFNVFEMSSSPPAFSQRKDYDVMPYRTHVFVPGHDARLHVVSQYGQSRSIDLDDRKQRGPGFTVSNEPKDLAISPDGKWMAVAFGYSSTPIPRVFHAATGKEAAVLEDVGHFQIDVVQFSPDSRLLAGGGHGGVSVWEIATGKKYLQFGRHERNTETVAFSPDGRLLASGGDRDIKLWEVATGKLLGSRRADKIAVMAIAFLPQRGRLASSGTEGVVLIWDVSKELREAAAVPKDLGRGVTAPAESGQWSKRFALDSRLGGIAFSPDGKTLAAGTQSGEIKLIDFATGKQTGILKGHTSAVRAILFAPDGKSMYSTASRFDDKQLPVYAWDIPSGKARWARGQTGTFPDEIELSPDAKVVYTTGSGGIPSWDTKSGEPLPRIKAYEHYLGAMAVSPDGKYMMVGGFKVVVLWDLQKNKQVRVWAATESEGVNIVNALAFSPDSKTAIAAPADGMVRAWDVATGERKLEWKTGGGASIAAYSPNGDLIAFVGDPIISGHLGRVCVCDSKTGKELLRLVGNGPKVAWSPDGRWLATADVKPYDKENFVLIWDVKAMLNR